MREILNKFAGGAKVAAKIDVDAQVLVHPIERILQLSEPEEKQLAAALAKLSYSSNSYRCVYVLGMYDDALRDTGRAGTYTLLKDYDAILHGAGSKHYLTQDHYCPQTLTKDWAHAWSAKVHKDWAGCIGNLLLMTRQLNSKVGNKGCAHRTQLILADPTYVSTTAAAVLCNGKMLGEEGYLVWSPEDVEARLKDVATKVFVQRLGLSARVIDAALAQVVGERVPAASLAAEDDYSEENEDDSAGKSEGGMDEEEGEEEEEEEEEDFPYASHADARPGRASLANIVILSTAAEGPSNAGRTSMYMEGGLFAIDILSATPTPPPGPPSFPS
jgi:ribosomal protein L12E/L44/L45/RPP1/RPP2